MEGCDLHPLVNDEEIRALEGLLDAFGTTFSLGKIANAYCKAGRDADLACTMLNDLSNTASTSSMQSSNILPNGEECSESSHCNIFKKSTKDSDVSSEELFSNFMNENATNNITEEFLCKMLGEGFQLDIDMIRKVLGYCGYDMQKSLETLLDLSTITSEKRDEFFGLSSNMSTDTCPKSGCLSSGGNMNMDLGANGLKKPRKQHGRSDVQQEVLSALFHVPESSEEFRATTSAVNAVKRSQPSRHVVVEPLMDTRVERKTSKMNQQKDIEEDAFVLPKLVDEGDSYMVLRKAVKEYRATMKEYYKAACEAFAKGDLALAGRLFEKGQFFHAKAREADEESVATIFEPRNEEIEDAVTIDVHNHSAKEAIRLLKCHLSSLSGIPSMKYLKLIVEMNDEDMSNGSCKRRIVKLLEKESITWTEGTNPGTILIHLEEIDPKRLSFGRK